MDALTDLTITVKLDTQAARREIADLRRHALQVLDELKAAYAASGLLSPSAGQAFSGGVEHASDTPSAGRRS